MKVFIWRCKDDNKIAIVRTMSEDDFLMLHKTKENVLRIIEKQNADEKKSLKVEFIEDPMIIEIMEWIAENNRPIVFEGADFLKRRLEDLEDATFNLGEEIAALKETIFDSQDNSLLKE